MWAVLSLARSQLLDELLEFRSIRAAEPFNGILSLKENKGRNGAYLKLNLCNTFKSAGEFRRSGTVK